MQSVKVNDEGQITIPSDLMMKMGIEKGMEFEFVKSDGCYKLVPIIINPLKELRQLCEGLAEELGLETEEDFVRYSKEIRDKRVLQL